MGKSKANLHTTRSGGGFSVIELLITVTVLSIVTGFGLMGIAHAKASMRLSGAAREYAAYIERARLFSIRSHAETESERANVTINDSRTSYNVNLDLDGDGTLDSRTIPLPDGVTFDTVETIGFDWRGRTWNTVGALTMGNAQVSITLKNDYGTVSVDVTGSGDVTIDSKVFDDKVPDVSLKIGDLASGATPVPTPASSSTPSSADPVATPDGSAGSLPTPTPDSGGTTGGISSSPSATPTPTPTATPTATPTPTPTATPTPTPTPDVCTLTADQVAVIISKDGTATIKLSHSSSSSQTISASSSKPSDLQVSPNSQAVSAGGSASFTIKSKKNTGIYSVTFSTGCGTKTVPVTVIL